MKENGNLVSIDPSQCRRGREAGDGRKSFCCHKHLQTPPKRSSSKSPKKIFKAPQKRSKSSKNLLSPQKKHLQSLPKTSSTFNFTYMAMVCRACHCNWMAGVHKAPSMWYGVHIAPSTVCRWVAIIFFTQHHVTGWLVYTLCPACHVTGRSLIPRPDPVYTIITRDPPLRGLHGICAEKLSTAWALGPSWSAPLLCKYKCNIHSCGKSRNPYYTFENLPSCGTP